MLPLPGLLPEPQSQLQVSEGQVVTLAPLGGRRGLLQDRRHPCPAAPLEKRLLLYGKNKWLLAGFYSRCILSRCWKGGSGLLELFLVLCHLSPPMSRWRSVPTGSHEGTRATERGECSHEGSCLPDSAPRSWYSGAPPCGPGTPGVCRPRGQPLTWPPGTWLERSLDIPLVDWVQSSTSQDFMLSNKPVNIP